MALRMKLLCDDDAKYTKYQGIELSEIFSTFLRAMLVAAAVIQLTHI